MDRRDLIVLASDYVGAAVVADLVTSGKPVKAVVVDGEDRGGFNEAIIRSAGADPKIGLFTRTQFEAALARPRGDALTFDLGVLAWWPRIIGRNTVGLPRRGWINIHPSLLPRDRGTHPTFWCLANGGPCGVSLHAVDEGIDSGPVFAQEELALSWEDTGQSVYLRAREQAIQLFKKSFDAIYDGRLMATPQDKHRATAHKRHDIDEVSTIDLDAPTTARTIFNLVRARTFPPHPTATFRDGDRTYSVRITIEETQAD